MEIRKDISKVKKGETICYHIGHLMADRIKKDSSGEFTEEAIILNGIASDLLKRSTAFHGDYVEGTGEFELKQKKLDFNHYMYLAKRIK